MPLARISLLKGRSPAYRAALADGVYQALRSAFGVPENNRFALIHQLEEGDLLCDPAYGGVSRGLGMVQIQITLNGGRTVEQKMALYAAIAENLAADPGVAKGDIHVSLVEVTKEDWSLGDGIAQYAAPPTG